MSNVSVIAAVEALSGADLAAADNARCVALLRDVRSVRGWLDAMEARVSSRPRDLAASTGADAGVADVHGSVGGVSAAEGRVKERRSKAIEDAPSFGDALAAGTIAAGHVDALANATAAATEQIKADLLADEHGLLAAASSKTPEEFARTCRERIRRLERDHGISRNRQQRKDSFISKKLNMATGMTDGRFAFHPELANQIFGAVDREVAAMIADGEHHGIDEFVNRTYDRQRLAAEALGRLVLGGHQAIRPDEADITYIIDAHTAASGCLHDHSVCETGDGAPVPPETVRRALCNGRLTPVILGRHGAPINVGRTLRTANRHQRRALRAIYRTCAITGCDVEFDQCEIHHIDWFEHGGLTNLANLLPVCRRHHHLVHEGGWTLHLAPDRTLTTRRPDGETHAICRPDMHDPDDQHHERPPAA